VTRRDHQKLLVDQLKERMPCMDCGDHFPAEAMDFDHVRGVKLGNISELLHLPGAKLATEIGKTELVCCGCHRIRTRDRRLDLLVDAAEMLDLEAELSGEV
jgi:hypothetical protein